MKFMLVGLSGVGINMTVYLSLIVLQVDYLAAAVLSFAVAVTSNFIWNFFWTFKGRAVGKSMQFKYLSYLVISLINLGVNLLLLKLLVESAGMNPTLGQLLAIGLVSLLNFIMNYTITFSEKNTAKKVTVIANEPSHHSDL
jgi:dolichol-phosphate mannosyltransferase